MSVALSLNFVDGISRFYLRTIFSMQLYRKKVICLARKAPLALYVDAGHCLHPLAWARSHPLWQMRAWVRALSAAQAGLVRVVRVVVESQQVWPGVGLEVAEQQVAAAPPVAVVEPVAESVVVAPPMAVVGRVGRVGQSVVVLPPLAVLEQAVQSAAVAPQLAVVGRVGQSVVVQPRLAGVELAVQSAVVALRLA